MIDYRNTDNPRRKALEKRNNKRVDGLLALAVVRRIAERQGSNKKMVSLDGVLDIRWRNNPEMRAKCRNRLAGQWRYRGLPIDKPAPAGLVRDAFREDMARAEQALRFDRALHKLCIRLEATGPSGLLSPDAFRTLDTYYVKRLPPMGDLERLTTALETNQRTSESTFFFEFGGAAMWRAWTALTGEGRRYAPKKRSLETRLDDVCASVGLKPESQPETERPNAAAATAEAPAEVAAAKPTPERLTPASTETRPRRWRAFRTVKLAALLLCASLLMSAAAYNYIDPNWRAYRVFRTEGFSKALTILKAQANGLEKGNYSWHLLAYSYYQNGHYFKAEELTLEVLSATESETIKGDCYHLLGLIRAITGQTIQAMGFFEEAKSKFDKKSTRYANVVVSIAEISESSKSIRTLDELQTTSEEYINAPYYWRIKSRALIKAGDYEGSLAASKNGLSSSVTETQMGRFFHLLGKAHALLGNIDSAFEYSDRAKDIFISNKASLPLVYNDVNYLLIRRCLGLPYDQIEESVIKFASEHNETGLEEELEKALTSPCRTSSG